MVEVAIDFAEPSFYQQLDFPPLGESDQVSWIAEENQLWMEQKELRTMVKVDIFEVEVWFF